MQNNILYIFVIKCEFFEIKTPFWNKQKWVNKVIYFNFLGS